MIEESNAAHALAEDMREALGQRALPYTFYDALQSQSHHFATSWEAVERAEKRGGNRIALHGEDGSLMHIRRSGEQWIRDDGIPLASVQATLDMTSAMGVSKRAALRARIDGDFALDGRLASLDAHAFRRIQDLSQREGAAVEIAHNARSFPAYKQSLDAFGRVHLPHGEVAQAIYDLDAKHDRKIADKEDRKDRGIAELRESMRATAAAWTVAESEAQASQDALVYEHQDSDTERYSLAEDMKLRADASPAYGKALHAAAPGILRRNDGMDAAATHKLAGDLDDLAQGRCWSDKTVRASSERLQAFAAQAEFPHAGIDRPRVEVAIAACRLSLHGVQNYHSLGDAAVLLAHAGQQQAVRELDARSGAAPADPPRPEIPDTGAVGPGSGTEVIAAENRLRAQDLAERAAAALGAHVGPWVQTAAEEWTATAATFEDGRTVRIAASTSGIVSVEDSPVAHGAEGDTATVTAAVEGSLATARDLAEPPRLPIRTDVPFANAPGVDGAGWRAMAEAENRLAGFLATLDEGMAVVSDDDAWYLEEVDGRLELMHGSLEGDLVVDGQSRFEIGLDWVDAGVEDLDHYTAIVHSVADDYLIDRGLWKTAKVARDDEPSLEM